TTREGVRALPAPAGARPPATSQKWWRRRRGPGYHDRRQLSRLRSEASLRGNRWRDALECIAATGAARKTRARTSRKKREHARRSGRKPASQAPRWAKPPKRSVRDRWSGCGSRPARDEPSPPLRQPLPPPPAARPG